LNRAGQWAAGRVALITGATSGFGHALARRLIGAGARVIATGRREERLQSLAAAMDTERLLIRKLDVRSRESLDRCLTTLPADFEPIDILFNNAGLALGMAKAHEALVEDWETMIETNILGLTRVTRAVLPGMVARNRGDILNMSSIAATYPYPGGNVYGATKAFVRQFSLNLRADLLGTKLRVTSFDPGICETEFSVVRFKGDEPGASKVYQGLQAISAEDLIDVVEATLRFPAHVNVNAIELMPVQQAFAPLAVHRIQT
jgi:3-hydroxy acid dehydrogenase / malonic semialdehyde reductase